MFVLDELNVVSRANVPIPVFNELKKNKTNLESLVYVGVDTNDFHCYIRPDNTLLRLPRRIEERVNGEIDG